MSKKKVIRLLLEQQAEMLGMISELQQRADRDETRLDLHANCLDSLACKLKTKLNAPIRDVAQN